MLFIISISISPWDLYRNLFLTGGLLYCSGRITALLLWFVVLGNVRNMRLLREALWFSGLSCVTSFELEGVLSWLFYFWVAAAYLLIVSSESCLWGPLGVSRSVIRLIGLTGLENRFKWVLVIKQFSLESLISRAFLVFR